jgi:hypothetical protein
MIRTKNLRKVKAEVDIKLQDVNGQHTKRNAIFNSLDYIFKK